MAVGSGGTGVVHCAAVAALLLIWGCATQTEVSGSDATGSPGDAMQRGEAQGSTTNGCVRCHTDKERLEELAPPQEEEEEEGGGG